MAHPLIRQSAVVIATVLVVCGQGLAQTPAVSIKSKLVEITVEIDDAFKAHPGLYDNCLAEGRGWAEKMRGNAGKEQRDLPAAFRGVAWTFDRNYASRSVIGRYVSIVRTDDTFEGGAHPNSVIDTILWDGDARKRISIRPFFKETADNGPTMKALAQLAQLAVAVEKMSRDIPVGGDDTVKADMTPEQYLAADTFINDGVKPALLEIGPVTLAPSTERGRSAGLTFHYSPYAVGPYVEGPYTVFVPWTKFRQFLSDEGAALFGGERPKDDEQK